MTKQSIEEDRHGHFRRPRDDNKPPQYQKGYAEFYKLRFKVSPGVLIPRPETELLVDEILSFLASQGYTLQEATIFDIGTGAGNIAISLAKNLLHTRGVKIIATDISQKALKIAQSNAKLHQVEGKIIFFKSNLLSSRKLLPYILYTKYLILVTNLPYIPSARIPYLDSSVKDFEPLVALDGGEDGFDLYRKLFKQIARFSLTPQGWKPKLIIGEIDYTHGELAVLEAKKHFPDYLVEIKTDLAHKQRVLIIKPSPTNY